VGCANKSNIEVMQRCKNISLHTIVAALYRFDRNKVTVADPGGGGGKGGIQVSESTLGNQISKMYSTLLNIWAKNKLGNNGNKF